MHEVEKDLTNSCGHTSHYRMRFVNMGVDLESDVNGLCATCMHEDTQFKAEIAKFFSIFFGD